jgi:hypothetical protein
MKICDRCKRETELLNDYRMPPNNTNIELCARCSNEKDRLLSALAMAQCQAQAQVKQEALCVWFDNSLPHTTDTRPLQINSTGQSWLQRFQARFERLISECLVRSARQRREKGGEE